MDQWWFEGFTGNFFFFFFFFYFLNLFFLSNYLQTVKFFFIKLSPKKLCFSLYLF